MSFDSFMKRACITAATVVMTLALFSLDAGAEYGRTPPTTIDPALLKIKEDAFLGNPVKKDYILQDSGGEEFSLGDFFTRPLVLVLSYYKCDGACPTTNRNLKAMLGGLKRSKAGRDFSILTVSFDRFDDMASLNKFKAMMGAGGGSDGWKMAVMKNAGDIKRLTKELGFNYFWSPRDRTFIHPNVYVVLSPQGRITRYLYAANTDGRDLDVAVADANFGTVGRSMVDDLGDLLLVACYSYNFKEGKYSLNYPLFIGAGALLVGFSFIVVSLTAYKRKKARR